MFSKDPGAAHTPRHTHASNGSTGSPLERIFPSPKSQHRALSHQIAHLASAAVDVSGCSSLTSKTCVKRNGFAAEHACPKDGKKWSAAPPAAWSFTGARETAHPLDPAVTRCVELQSWKRRPVSPHPEFPTASTTEVDFSTGRYKTRADRGK